MSNFSHELDLPFGHWAGSSRDENLWILDAVKASVHTVAFVATGLFMYLITVTVLGSSELRQNPRYILLCQHSACISSFNVSGAVVHCLRFFRWPTARLICWILFDLQVVMARGLIMTLTLMCICTYLSICQPLQYPMQIHRFFYWIMLLTWLLTLINPVVFTILACTRQPWDYVIGLDTECSTALESKACIISSLLLLILTVLLIFGSYLMIYLEGHRAGHFSQSNSKGRQTILIHSLQMSFHILPAVIIITRLKQSLAAAVAIFLVFSVAQSLSPVVYGLRCRELQDELPRFLPQCLQGLARVDSTPNMEVVTEMTTSSETAASTGSPTSSNTSMSTCPANITVSAIVPESQREEKDQLDFAENEIHLTGSDQEDSV